MRISFYVHTRALSLSSNRLYVQGYIWSEIITKDIITLNFFGLRIQKNRCNQVYMIHREQAGQGKAKQTECRQQMPSCSSDQHTNSSRKTTLPQNLIRESRISLYDLHIAFITSNCVSRYSFNFTFVIAPSLLLSGTSSPFRKRIKAGKPYTLYSSISLGLES